MRAAVVSMLFALVAGVAIFLFTEKPQRHNLDFAGYGHGFDGDSKLPREKIQAALEEARDSMRSRVKTSQILGNVQIVLQWAGFFLGAVVTVIAGYHWQTTAEDMKLTELKKALGRNAKSMRYMGVMSGLAAVLTVAAAKTGDAATTFYERAKETQGRLNAATSDLQNAKDAEEAQAVLDDLAVRR